MTKHLSESQIIPYLQGLAARGNEVTLLSFEERFPDAALERAEVARVTKLLSDSKIRWKWLRYHKQPSLPATGYDVFLGTIYSVYLSLRHRINVVHSRGYVPLPIALFCKLVCRTKLVFDVRGLMAEEYVDAGHWKHGSLPYRATKWFERLAFRHAEAVIVLTHRVAEILRSTFPSLQKTPVYVIPCCVNVQSYSSGTDRVALRQELGIAGSPVLAYVGSLGTWYMGREMVSFFKRVLQAEPQATFLVLTQFPELAREMLQEQEIAPERYLIQTVASSEVPRWLSAADFAIAFIKPCYSKISSSPTKVGEYLAAGLPFVVNRGIGDLDELLTKNPAGALVDSFEDSQYAVASQTILRMLKDPAVHGRCREIAEKNFSMKQLGQPSYIELYRALEKANR
jgi:glycosyltransferase involved in cell wall biosynthesis